MPKVTQAIFPVDGGNHNLYIESSGNPDGLQIKWEHGGPGAGSSSFYHRLVDPKKFGMVLADQRGAGKSLPLGEISNNTTRGLVNDILAIMEFHRYWVEGGKSWGALLALEFAIRRPERVAGLVLVAPWLDIDFMYRPAGAAQFFPEAWARLMQLVPEAEQKNFVEFLYRRMLDGSMEEQERIALEFARWEEAIMRISQLTDADLDKQEENSETRAKQIAVGRLELHYLANRCFLPDPILPYILDNAKKITCPVVIVNGRFDMCCPPRGAFLLSKALPDAELRIIQSGHHGSEMGSAIGDAIATVCHKAGAEALKRDLEE